MPEEIHRQAKAKFHLFGYNRLAPGVAHLALLHCDCEFQGGLNRLVLELLSVCAPKTARRAEPQTYCSF